MDIGAKSIILIVGVIPDRLCSSIAKKTGTEVLVKASTPQAQRAFRTYRSSICMIAAIPQNGCHHGKEDCISVLLEEAREKNFNGPIVGITDESRCCDRLLRDGADSLGDPMLMEKQIIGLHSLLAEAIEALSKRKDFELRDLEHLWEIIQDKMDELHCSRIQALQAIKQSKNK